MANERAGRIAEALTVLAAEDAAAPLSLDVHWEPTDTALMVRPDVLIGPTDAPRAIVLSHRADSRRDWHKKFWRNIGELIDARAAFPTVAVVNVGLGTEAKEQLMVILERLVDASVRPSDVELTAIDAWIHGLAADAPSDRDGLLTFVRGELPTAPEAVTRFVETLTTTLADAIRDGSTAFAGLGASMNARDGRAQEIANAWRDAAPLRRGLAKLLVFGEPAAVLPHVHDNGDITDADLGAAMEPFGWTTPVMGDRWRIEDDEILGALGALPRARLVELLESAPEAVRTMAADVASPDWLRATATALATMRDEVTDPGTLTALLRTAETDPTLDGRITETPPDALRGNWLYRVLSALLKLASGRKQGFGYEQLVSDVRTLPEAARQRVLAAGATATELSKAGTTDSYRRKLVDWVSGLKERDLTDWQVRLTAEVLAGRLQDIDAQAFRQAAQGLPAMIRRLTYEDRLGPYRFFEPLRELVELALQDAGLAYTVEERHETLVSEASPGNRNPGTTPVIRVGDTLIHRKSAHGSHTNDKTKELCGRAFALRYRLDGDDLAEADGVASLALVLDGDFSPDHVRHLVRSGWDVVVRPSQMRELVAALQTP